MTAPAATGDVARVRPSLCRLATRAFLALCVCVVGLAVAGWFERDAVLRRAAELWIVSDQPAPADAVAVFGGGLEYRPFAAAEYYRRGLVPKVLLSNIGTSPAERLGIFKSQVEAETEILQKLGVPATAIEIFGSNLIDTFAEAKALHVWALHAGARRIMVPTDVFAARRLRWTLRHAFGNDAAIIVPTVERLDYHADNWWRTPQGVVGFQNEVLKYLYYRVKY